MMRGATSTSPSRSLLANLLGELDGESIEGPLIWVIQEDRLIYEPGDSGATTKRRVEETIKRNLRVDWTEPHRDQVRAEIRAAVKRVLRKRGVRETDFEPFIARFIQQAEAQYAEWPLVA